MKKIFAIALALVMVLSMASAFATYCNWGAWDCDTTTIRCGKATIEVVPYVRAATACGFEFASNGCAAAIPNENVYYAVKLVVDADVNEDWWTAAKFNLKTTDVVGPVNLNWGLPAWKDVKNGGTFWLYATATNVTDAKVLAANLPTDWEKEDADFTFGAKNVFASKAAKSSAKVCATLKSVWAIGTAKDANYAWDGAAADAAGRPGVPAVKIGDYTFSFGRMGDPDTGAEFIRVTKAPNYELYIMLKDDKVDYVWAKIAGDQYRLNGRNPAGEFTGKNETTGAAVALGTSCNEGAWVKEVFDFLKIDFLTCMTDQGISNNFGWNDEIKSCTAYKTAGMAVVDSECVVAIPKTGDASVLAWLF